METLNSRTARIMQQGIAQDLRAVQDAAPGTNLRALSSAVEEFYSGLDELDQALEQIRNDGDLSPEGKANRRDALAQAWLARSAEQAAKIERLTGEAIGSESEPLTVPAPADDPAVLEARLANARTDARMLLDGTEPTQLTTAMRRLVEHNTDPAISYLLVATEWGTHYLRSRTPASGREARMGGDARNGLLLEWQAARQALTPHLLDDAGKAAWERRARLQPLTRIPQMVTATRQFAIKDRGLRQS